MGNLKNMQIMFNYLTFTLFGLYGKENAKSETSQHGVVSNRMSENPVQTDVQIHRPLETLQLFHKIYLYA